jgi:hypothetical protein
MQSGTKLVLGIFGLAVAAGVLSWAYRYEATHDASVFWGPRAIELIAKPSTVIVFELPEEPKSAGDSIQIFSKTYRRVEIKNLSDAPGMIHLRNAILTDDNYNWGESADTFDWRWCLEFSRDRQKVTILFNEDFSILGRLNQEAHDVWTVDSTPIAATLRQYFKSIGVFGVNEPESSASNAAE